MLLNELRIANLRNIEALQIDFGPGLNLLEGPNGAGKTSILEAAYVLSHGGSFRTHKPDVLTRREGAGLAASGAGVMGIFARVQDGQRENRVGLQREAGRWVGRLDGQPVTGLASLFSHCAVVCFEPGSHALIAGPAEGRRAFLDWGMFHVEHAFADWLRRCRRALRQRNALLKQAATDAELEVWNTELALAAEPLTDARERYVDRLGAALRHLLDALLPELGPVTLHFRAGWDRARSLTTVLGETAARDRLLGHTTRGPHRADWSLSFAQAPGHEHLSRGQEKLCAIACLLAQATLYRETRQAWPVIALDDFCSELDPPHQGLALQQLTASDAQILMTGTEIPAALLSNHPPSRRFHVEQGRVRALL